MSNHTQMPPSLDKPWNFGAWDCLKTSYAPCTYRGFWYHNGDGDKLVVIWRHSFDEGGRWTVSGDIYRCKTGLEALELWRSLQSKVGRDGGQDYDGLFIFHGNRRISEPSIIGEMFPHPLPDGRWL